MTVRRGIQYGTYRKSERHRSKRSKGVSEMDEVTLNHCHSTESSQVEESEDDLDFGYDDFDFLDLDEFELPREDGDEDEELDDPEEDADEDEELDDPEEDADEDEELDDPEEGADEDEELDDPEEGADEDEELDDTEEGADEDEELDDTEEGADEDEELDDTEEGADEDEELDNPEEDIINRFKPCNVPNKKRQMTTIDSGVTIVKANTGNRIVLNHSIVSALGITTDIQFGYSESSSQLLIGKDLPNDFTKYNVKIQKNQRAMIYNKNLVTAISSTFNLDFNECTSKTFSSWKVVTQNDIDVVLVDIY